MRKTGALSFFPLSAPSAALLFLVVQSCGTHAPLDTTHESAHGGTSGNTVAAGSSGAANSTGGATPVVLPCRSLPASPSPTWERITPPGDVGDSQCVRVHPSEAGTVFVMMHKGGNGAHYPTDGLYKSKDCGATWSSLINTGTNGDTVASGSW